MGWGSGRESVLDLCEIKVGGRVFGEDQGPRTKEG